MKIKTILLASLALAWTATVTGEESAATVEAPDKAIIVSQVKGCVNSIDDQSTTSCTRASSTPRLGRLYPITQDLFVAGSGEVGIGTTQPTSQLTVNGLVYSTSGGFRFPDGSLQATAITSGPQGPNGPQGPTGPAGPAGPPGQNGVTSVNGLTGPFLNLIGSGGTTVSASGNTITVSTPSVPCTYGSTTYSTNSSCYTTGDFIPCTFGARQIRLRCLASGAWQVITSTACNNPTLTPICGF